MIDDVQQLLDKYGELSIEAINLLPPDLEDLKESLLAAFWAGQAEGWRCGHDTGFGLGKQAGTADGQKKGRTEGYSEGHTEGYQQGREDVRQGVPSAVRGIFGSR